MENRKKKLERKLAQVKQSHVFTFWDGLTTPQKEHLLDDLEGLDLSRIAALSVQAARTDSNFLPQQDLEPAPVFKKPETKEATERGEELLAGGKVAALMVAGGQGTRLGLSGPKGCFQIGPVSEHCLFQIFAEGILATQQAQGAKLHWFIMTSPANDAQSRDFFKQCHYFGLDPARVHFFVQGTNPVFTPEGKLLLAEKDRLARAPDGHGGTLPALAKTGMLDLMEAEGIEHLSYFQVDNPLVRVLDPLFIGLHQLTGSEMSSKSLAKADDFEKVGNFCRAGGKLYVIEYSALPNELAVARNPDGRRRFDAGSIAIHVLRVDFIRRLTRGEFKLPWHRANKKMPCVDPATGRAVMPESPNAIKLESFIFDALPLAGNPLVLETRREEEFSPVKNAEGADSPASCRRDLTRRAARWLESAGGAVPRDENGEPDCVLEISPLFALDAGDLTTKSSHLGPPIHPGQSRFWRGG